MSATPRVRIQQADFDVAAELRALREADAGIGALASFVGCVRDGGGERIEALELEHYPGMTERAIEAMVDAATVRFALRAVRVVHRIGRLAPTDQIVLVVAAAPHRQAAFDGCAFLMDYLKTQAPFWKKEHGPDGARWVDARAADDAALARWGLESRNVTG